jgi:2-succinyl-5-enolpyruvyl-6-hydroxy-3-cyclohexene-1-carboxylate synthase
LQRWQSADAAAQRVQAQVLATEALNEPAVAKEIAAAAPPGSVLTVASSMPLRDLDRTMTPRDDLRVFANRGLSGIDGTLSTAMGAADYHGRTTNGRSFALVGDLAFLHDLSALARTRSDPPLNLHVVVINNCGGGIFSLLPHADHRNGFDTLFGTPHDVQFEHLARSVGWDYHCPTDLPGLRTALASRGPSLIEITTQREANAALHRALRAQTERAVAEPTRSSMHR